MATPPAWWSIIRVANTAPDPVEAPLRQLDLGEDDGALVVGPHVVEEADVQRPGAGVPALGEEPARRTGQEAEGGHEGYERPAPGCIHARQ